MSLAIVSDDQRRRTPYNFEVPRKLNLTVWYVRCLLRNFLNCVCFSSHFVPKLWLVSFLLLSASTHHRETRYVRCHEEIVNFLICLPKLM